MPAKNERHVSEMVEASIAEMIQIQGGAAVDFYVNTAEGETTYSSSILTKGKRVTIDFCKTG